MSNYQKTKMSEHQLKTLAIEEQKLEEELPETKDRLKKYGLKSTKNYVDKNELYEHMKIYGETRDKIYKEQFLPEYNAAVEKAKKEGKQPPSLKDQYWQDKWFQLKPVPDDVVSKGILAIVKHLATRPNFAGYSFIQDCQDDALLSIIQYIDNFDCNKSKNPFAYFTQVAWFCFIRRIQLEKKQSAIKGRIMMNMTDDSFTMFDENDVNQPNEDNVRNTHTFVEIAYQMQQKELAEQEEKARIKAEKKQQKNEETNLSFMFE